MTEVILLIFTIFTILKPTHQFGIPDDVVKMKHCVEMSNFVTIYWT